MIEPGQIVRVVLEGGEAIAIVAEVLDRSDKGYHHPLLNLVCCQPAHSTFLGAVGPQALMIYAVPREGEGPSDSRHWALADASVIAKG